MLVTRTRAVAFSVLTVPRKVMAASRRSTPMEAPTAGMGSPRKRKPAPCVAASLSDMSQPSSVDAAAGSGCCSSAALPAPMGTRAR